MGAAPKLPWWFDIVMPILLPIELFVVDPIRRICR